MKQQDMAQVQELTDWINQKLRFIDKVIREARMSSNYGKEIQYIGMRDAYVEFLKKLGADLNREQAA